MAEKRDNYQAITDTIVASLEAILSGASAAPSWCKPWSSIGSPRNAFTNRPYNGINAFLLALKPYSDPRYATFNQIKAEGGMVRKGEKGTQIVFWTFIQDRKDEKKKIPLLRIFTVFNVKDQTDGIELKAVTLPNKEERKAHIEAVVAATGATIQNGGNASYNPSSDVVTMPIFESFDKADSYYSTLAHELTHWTGSSKRLNRDLTGRFGSESYAMEELVAELGNAFFCQTMGIDGDMQKNHVAYIASWIKVLKNDKHAIFKASTLAKEAVKVLIGEQVEEEAETEEAA